MRMMRWAWLAVVGLGVGTVWGQVATAPKTATAPKAATTTATSTAPKGVPYAGDLVSFGLDTFVVADAKGVKTTVKVGAGTKYQLDGNNSTYAKAVQMGVTVKGNLGADGVATTVTSKTKPKPPATKPATAPASTAPKLSRLDQMKGVLQSTDEEWKVLRPLVEKILKLQDEASALDKVVAVKDVKPVKGTIDDIKADLAAKRACG